MEAAACGEIGLEIAYFYSLTPRQFYNIQNGYFRKLEAIEAGNWLRTKVTAYFIYLGLPGKKNSRKKSYVEFEDAWFKTKKKYKVLATGKTKEALLIDFKERIKNRT